MIGTGKTYAQVAETIPGPTTAALSELAKRRSAYVVAGIYEREGPVLYNTSVLIDRKGTLVGRYRKVYLPRGELEGGLTPGSSYPVFRTDFGTVGMMICYDVFFADPARALATAGAELILMPIWGGDLTLAKARAIENEVGIFGYDYPTAVVDPNPRGPGAGGRAGRWRARPHRPEPLVDPPLGDMRGRFMKELRAQIPALNIRLLASAWRR